MSMKKNRYNNVKISHLQNCHPNGALSEKTQTKSLAFLFQ